MLHSMMVNAIILFIFEYYKELYLQILSDSPLEYKATVRPLPTAFVQSAQRSGWVWVARGFERSDQKENIWR